MSARRLAPAVLRERLNIQTQLVLTSLISLVLATVVVAVMARLFLVAGPSPGELPALVGRVPIIEETLARGGDDAAIGQAAVPADLPPGVRVLLVAADGAVRADSSRSSRPESSAGASPGQPLAWLVSPTQSGRAQLIQTVPITVDGRAWGYLIAVYSGPLGPSGLSTIGVVAVVFGLGLLAGVLPFWWFGRGLVRGLRSLAGVVGQIAGGDLAARASFRARRDELGQLANDVNAMAASLQDAQLRVRAAIEARQFMVAAVSHDLRTPLTALIAHAEAIRAGVSEDPRQSLEVIYTRAVRLKELINDLFELAALDAEPGPWPTKRTDLAEVVREAVVAALPALEAAGLQVEVEIPDTPVWADLAPGKLDRLVDNLLANARDYGAAGGWLGVNVERCVGGRVRVEVVDRGVGIPASDRMHVFERFYRSDGARRSTAGGSGLGLAIAREIVMRHAGEIGLDSPSEGGTCVWFELPTAPG
jgi:signal transduction histidine kinase